MRQYLVSVLLLAIVALSSSNVLPIYENDITKEQLGFDSQHNDNTFRNRYQTRNVLDEIYNMYFERVNKPGSINKLHLKYADADNNQDDDIFSIISKNDNYNGEGFRKEQWHNYPRQLDRLHQLYEHDSEKRNLDPDPNDKRYIEEAAPDYQDLNEISNEIHLDSNTGLNNVYDAEIMATNPLILEMRLASLNKDINTANANAQFANLVTEMKTNSLREDENNEQFRNENPKVNIIKVKREGVEGTQNYELTDNLNGNKMVNKRIFSLWSRLQSLNHKGHELQHRRHLHAFYGLPDSDGGGTLTAETRATLMRPPGSPLRWG